MFCRPTTTVGLIPAVEDILRKVEVDTLEPAGNLVDGGGLVDNARVRPAVDEVGGCEEVGPKLAAVSDRVLVELAKGLFRGKGEDKIS